MSGSGPDNRALSDQLLRFTAGLRHEREPLLQFALRVARETRAGSRLLDVGAGESPYRELFSHLHYETSDWENSVHPGARAVDHVGPAHDLPVPDCAYDAVLCTQVLEHVPNPAGVIEELHRVLRPGGLLYMTVPLAWELHELPFDFFRYTPHGLATLLQAAGFERLDIRPRNGCFSTLAQLLENAGSSMGSYPDGLDGRRAEVLALLREMARTVASFDDLDARMVFPLGYSVVARRPDAAADAQRAPAAADARAAAGLAAARRFVTLCFAGDVVNDPSLLARYAGRFSEEDDATLVIYAPDVDPAVAAATFTRIADGLGLAEPGSADVILLQYRGRAPDEGALAAAVDAALALRPPWGAFAGLHWINPAELHRLCALAAPEASLR
jgi:SAM-dependent methyltransferase